MLGLEKEEIRRLQYDGDLTGDDRVHHFTTGKKAAEMLKIYFEEHGSEYQELSGNLCEIPDGVRQYWRYRGSQKTNYRHCTCLVTNIPCRKLRDLVHFLFRAEGSNIEFA